MVLGFLVVYSITSKESFKEVSEFRERVLKVKDKDQYPMILLGNKCDLSKDRVVTTDEGKECAAKYNIPFKECSAKNKINIDESFEEIIHLILKAKEEGVYGSSGTSGGGSFVPETTKSKSKCNLL